MSSLFSDKGPAVISPGVPTFGRKKGKFRRMAGEIIREIGDSSPTAGFAVEPRDKGKFGMIPRPGINPPGDDERRDKYFEDKSKKQKEQNIINREKYPEGYGGMIDMPIGTGTTTQVIDKDGDGIDDRYQSAPGQDDYRGGIFSREERDKRKAERELKRKERESKEKKKPLPNIKERGRGRKRKALDNAVSFSRRIPNRSEEDRRRNRRRRKEANIPTGEQQPVGSGYKPDMPTFGKLELQ